MNDDLFDAEQVSCCIDGESTTYLAKISRSAKARACWCRYHFIRTVMRENQTTTIAEDFHHRVMQALENEPTILAPKLIKHRTSISRQIIKPIAGLAIAASVAAVTVMGFQNLYSGQSSSTLLTSLAPSTPPVNQESVLTNKMISSQAEKVLASDALGDDLDTYLLGHMEQSMGGGSAQGMLPYVRLAGFDESQ